MLAILLTALGAQAQKKIKAIDITVPLPKVGEAVGSDVSAISVDLFGSKNILGDIGAEQTSVGFLKYDGLGHPTQIGPEEVMLKGSKYIMEVGVRNMTDNMFNYKNDGSYTADASTLKVTINGKPAKIIHAHARNLLCKIEFTTEGRTDTYVANNKVSTPDGKHAGYGYVDLGLPSGTLWATCNLGTDKPEGYGSFVAYGETKTKDSFTKKNFTGFGSNNFSNPYHFESFAAEEDMFSTHTERGMRLKPEHDAARQNMGGEWQIPTRMQCREMFENTYAKVFAVNGVRGALFTSKINGKSIFIPYAGLKEGTTVNSRGHVGEYLTANSVRSLDIFLFLWGSDYTEDQADCGSRFDVVGYGMHNEDPGGNPCYLGHSVRAVWGGQVADEDKEKGSVQTKGSGKKNSSGNSNKSDGKKKSGSKLKGLFNKGKSLLGL